MPVDHYSTAAPRWATGAELVYAPIVAELLAMSPQPLAGRAVLDWPMPYDPLAGREDLTRPIERIP
jgi:hypothetical protein